VEENCIKKKELLITNNKYWKTSIGNRKHTMNKKIIALLIILVIASLSTVSAGNNTTTIDYPTVHIEEAETVTALEFCLSV